MSYRDDLEAAQARIAALEAEVARLRGAPVPPPPTRRPQGILDEIGSAIDEVAREVGGFVQKQLAKPPPDAVQRAAQRIAGLPPADVALVERVVAILEETPDRWVRGARVRAAVEDQP